MRYIIIVIFLNLILIKADDDFEEYHFSEPGEMMIAQETRRYETIVKPPIRIIKPSGVTNSHRPQYNVDSLEDDHINHFGKGKEYNSVNSIRAKESMIRDAVLRALDRKDHVGKFAQILPIIRAMSGSQRVALASLVASQVTTPPGRAPLNLSQVRSMFGNNANTTSDLMLPILLDMANLIRRAVRSGKEPREVKQQLLLPQRQLLRRSYTEDDTYLDKELFETENEIKLLTTQSPNINNYNNNKPQKSSPQVVTTRKASDNTSENKNLQEHTLNSTITTNIKNITNIDEYKRNILKYRPMTSQPSTLKVKLNNASKAGGDNGSLDLTADSSNQTLSQDLPVAEKLRSYNRFNVNYNRRGISPKPPVIRRTTPESSVNAITRRRPVPARKLPIPVQMDQNKCELFTNTLCLHSEDYPTEAIVQSLRRNKATTGALLADFKDPGDGALDGVTAAQEAKYTPDHYLTSNRRGDMANRDFASAGEAGFMCPSTVKYARPQRARATSGQWKYIVNTGEHTQTLRLEKCLKPKESCTYLTDNFKSKCVQVYNYHRLLTWDQQNGLHMDIFKVPTCCSCHIEGYSVAFPPLGHRVHESSSEQFPEELSSEHGNHAFETVQSSVQKPSVSKAPPFAHNQPLESYSHFSGSQNFISGTAFNNAKLSDNDQFTNPNLPGSNPMDSYGNSYFPDSFNQASSIKNLKRPPIIRNQNAIHNVDIVTLPSYLEPPTPSSGTSFSFSNEIHNKFKSHGGQFKRGAIRPNSDRRRPIRKNISGGSDDLIPSGSSNIESVSHTVVETLEDFNDDLEDPDIIRNSTNYVKRVTIAPKLHAVTNETASTTLAPIHNDKETIYNSKRVNYNYHPIIDFFENGKGENDSIDREDTLPTFIPPSDTEWKPLNHPPPRYLPPSNLINKKKS